MKCLYCQNDCEFVELEDLMAKTAEVWKCTKCPHPVRFNKFIKSDRVAMICISMKMHDETYAVHIYHEAGPFEITKYFQIGKVGLKRNMNYIDFEFTPIVQLPGIPNITPTNIEEKLPIYITFS